MKDITESNIQRQNILNNRFALIKAQEHFALGGVLFEGEYVFTKQQVAALFDISDATIERYLAAHDSELKNNGYIVLRGDKLKKFKQLDDVSLIDEGNKAPALGILTFRAVLNLAMLLTESQRARDIRTRLLDIVMEVVTERAGGHTQYINQRDDKYLLAAFQESNYRKAFTSAISQYVEGNNGKYARLTNHIYQCIFEEDAAEYKRVLNLPKGTKEVRDTMYAEILTLIASFESGLAHELQKKSEQLSRKLSESEAQIVLKEFASHPLFKPQLLEARTKMASRDLGFRDAFHQKLQAYIQAIPQADFERFLGEASQTLQERLTDPATLDVFKRLKDR